MRSHVETTLSSLRAARSEIEQIAERPDDGHDDILALALDLLDRLEEVRTWLRRQPLSSLLDDDARSFMTRYRSCITRAAIFGERYFFAPSGDTLDAWTGCLDELALAERELDALPEE